MKHSHSGPHGWQNGWPRVTHRVASNPLSTQGNTVGQPKAFERRPFCAGADIPTVVIKRSKASTEPTVHDSNSGQAWVDLKDTSPLSWAPSAVTAGGPGWLLMGDSALNSNSGEVVSLWPATSEPLNGIWSRWCHDGRHAVMLCRTAQGLRVCVTGVTTAICVATCSCSDL